MKIVWITFAIIVVAANIADARRKRKFDGDFEFAEEDDVKNVATSGKVSEKKRWIHDPSSELCQPLNCKKKELCLLENPYTAVCVSKKDLHKSGDVVVPKSKLSPEEAAKYSQEQSDDDVFYDSDDEDDEEDPESNQDVLTARCNPCPVVKPTFLCGTDNRTYSSLCRLDYHNCIHHTSVKVYCKGFCPCKEGEAHRKKQKQESERLTNLMNKYKATVLEESKAKENLGNSIDKYTFTPQDFNYENKHYKYIKYTKHENKPTKVVTNPPYYEDKERNRGDNDVIERKPNVRAKSECPPAALQAMGDRLLDWFSVIMADSKRRQTHTRTKTAATRFPAGCKNEVRWMFHHLDGDSDSKLTLQELYDLEHDQNERCIKPFLDECDIDRDIFVTPHEWCKCFDKTDRPCAAVKRRISTNMLGVYVPECDSEGYYYHTQCHVSVGMCWCVDKHGVELPNSRTRGKPNCETLLGKSKGKQSDVVSDDDEDDDDDSDQDIEGSADQPLDF